MKRTLLIALLLLTGAVLADPDIYRWVDEDGKVHYSDCPPPDCEVEIVEVAPPPSESQIQRAEQELQALLERDQRSMELRELQRREKELLREEDQRQDVEDLRECISARQNLHVLEQPVAVYRIDEKGDHVWLDDEDRPAEIERLKAIIQEKCPPPE